MDIFNAVSKHVDSTQHYNIEQTSNISTKTVQHTMQSTSSKVQNKQDDKQIQQHLSNTIKKLNDQMQSLNINIKFGFNSKIDELFVDVTERSSGKLIRTIPTQDAMKLAEKMKEVIGMIFDKKG